MGGYILSVWVHTMGDLDVHQVRQKQLDFVISIRSARFCIRVDMLWHFRRGYRRASQAFQDRAIRRMSRILSKGHRRRSIRGGLANPDDRIADGDGPVRPGRQGYGCGSGGLSLEHPPAEARSQRLQAQRPAGSRRRDAHEDLPDRHRPGRPVH